MALLSSRLQGQGTIRDWDKRTAMINIGYVLGRVKGAVLHSESKSDAVVSHSLLCFSFLWYRASLGTLILSIKVSFSVSAAS